ncbi:unnamed protein product [Protopolystoma xenopodis]|uniref:Transient receptor ion channel domain-containing protein n=1 Tax=Protopolystoma xenopodis TaxID=117903 RepID=A0A448XHY8_9PLAT|nr:unnamed protein product [Protopolystoma xenopodis]
MLVTFNPNCVDPLGRRAVTIAIEYDQIEILALLLRHNLELGDALLHAISEENIEAVHMIVQAQEDRHAERSTEMHFGRTT